MSIKTKMTAIADKFRSLLGKSGTMGLDEMATNLDECQETVDTQSDLLDLAIETLSSKVLEVPPANPVLQSKNVLPTEYEQTVMPDSGYDGLSSVLVGNISSSYIGSGISKKEAQEFTPGTKNQIISAGQYLDGDQVILGDSNLITENIKLGVEIFGVEGVYSGGSDNGIDTSDATATANDIIEGKTAYVNGELVTGTIMDFNSSEIAIPKESHSFYSESGDQFLKLVTPPLGIRFAAAEDTSISVHMPASELGDATAGDVIAGKTFTSINGLCITGTMASGSGGIPSGISKIATGTFSLSDDTTTYSISHNLETVPNFLIVTAVGDIDASDYHNYVMCYSVFASNVITNSGTTTDVSNIMEVGMCGYVDGDSSYTSLFSQDCYDLSERFTSNETYILLEDWVEASLKAGATYRWICGVADF